MVLSLRSTTISAFDLAENYTVDDNSIEPGDIVTTSAIGNFVVEKTNTPYQQLIGAVSTEPGITLADWGDKNRTDKRPIALAGRVPVKVSLENGPIRIGDFVTSSSIPGVGMNACPKEAMENFEVTEESVSSEEESLTGEQEIERPEYRCGSGMVLGTALESFDGDGIGKVTVFISPHYVESAADDNTNFSLKQFVAILSGKIIEAIIKITNLFVDYITVGTSEKPSGITMYDTETGEPYCVIVKNGNLSVLGNDCSDLQTYSLLGGGMEEGSVTFGSADDQSSDLQTENLLDEEMLEDPNNEELEKNLDTLESLNDQSSSDEQNLKSEDISNQNNINQPLEPALTDIN